MVVFLGAIVTAIITLILLNGQSTAEEVREKNVKVFEKKSLLFEKFISKLYSIINNQKLSASDFNNITTVYYSKLVLYLKEKNQKEIIKYLGELGDCVGIYFNDGIYDLAQINNCYEKIKENIYNIINVLTQDLGFDGKINISFQRQLDYKVLPILFRELLLEEMDKIFLNEKIFNKAHYMTIANGTFLVLGLNGKFTTGVGIHIGPFFNFTANEKFPAYDGIYFRFFTPMLNPVSELYTVNDGTNYNKTLIDFKDSEDGLLSLQKPLPPRAFELINIDSDLYNKELDIIRFDDKNTLEKYVGSIHIKIVKAIATRAYFHYLDAKTKRDNLTIKDLYDKFESITIEQYTEYMLTNLGTSIDFSK
jgi:hypothetical protein